MSHEQEQSIFQDPRGIRRRALQLLSTIGACLFLSASGYFIWGLLIGPKLDLPSGVLDSHLGYKALAKPSLVFRTIKPDWNRSIQGSTNTHGQAKISKKSTNSDIVLGYISSNDQPSLLSLEHHADELTHVAVEWFSMTDVWGTLREDPSDKARLLCLRKHLGFLPILRNIADDRWQPEAVEELAHASQRERDAFASNLVKRMPAGAIGLLVEWCQTDPSYKNEISKFLKEIAEKLHAAGKECWFSVPTGHDFDALDLESISDSVDRFLACLYEEHSEPNDPGPLASRNWFEGWLKTMMSYGDPDQWVIGMGSYSCDWRVDNNTVETLGFADAMARVSQVGTHPVDEVDCSENAPNYQYLAGLNQDQQHEVNFLDAITFFNERRAIAPYHPGGVAIYRLGEEDPGVWEVLKWNSSHRPTLNQLTRLRHLVLDDQIASLGAGDFITVGEDPHPGERQVDLEKNGDISESYTSFPMPANITRKGDPGLHQVALTFDDGPDPRWTPKILKILKEKNAPATFFVLGTQAQHYPRLLQQIAKSGYEIGNHTYTHQNIAEASDEEIELELNATTRIIEALTGHSTAYFRPPFGIDGTPTQPSEVRALRRVRDRGYLTVAESVDPRDWERPGADIILERIKQSRSRGGVILLHDSGGDRAQTVEALPKIIDYLRARGDTLVPLSKIIKLPQETVMPAVRQNQPLSTRYVYGGFTFLRFLENAAWTLLVILTLLALLRIFFYSLCAFYHHRLECMGSHESIVEYSPPLSVLLAAYNEERVIASTLRHLLDADYKSPVEIIVINDGSTDGTARVVKRFANKISRIRLIEQSNSGKASALRRGMEEATHDTIVMIDADTMIAHDALKKLITPLSNPKVGAVAGYIRVGNTKHWLGRFQEIEYIGAFEIDKRAQDLLGCIIVAPGAFSAFRRKALNQVEPINNDTLAEDTDLTLQLHRIGWQIGFASQAFADTEAPESIKALFSQRFRWSFGTLQCLWKHAECIFAQRTGWLGWFALPSVWIFQILVVALTPILDCIVLWSLWLGRGVAIWPYFITSLLLDVALATVAMKLANQTYKKVWLAIPMRLFYRPLLGYIVWKCIFKAIGGSWVRWSKIERTASAIVQKNKQEHHDY